MKNVLLKPLVPSVRHLLVPVPRLAPADGPTDTQTDEYDNPLAHVRRGLTTVTLAAHAHQGLNTLSSAIPSPMLLVVEVWKYVQNVKRTRLASNTSIFPMSTVV